MQQQVECFFGALILSILSKISMVQKKENSPLDIWLIYEVKVNN